MELETAAYRHSLTPGCSVLQIAMDDADRDGNGALETGVVGAVNLAHAAQADLGGDFMGVKAWAGSQ